MIACVRCSRENLDHYKFCLGCGVEIGRDVRTPTPNPTSGSGLVKAVPPGPSTPIASGPAFSTPRGIPVSALAGAAMRARDGAHDPLATGPLLELGAPSPATRGSELRLCSSCGARVPLGFTFCGSCGARTAPPAPASDAAPARTMYFGGTQAAATAAAPRGRLVLIRPDGSEGGSHSLQDGENLIGRGTGLLFDGDAYLSPRHAVITFGPGGAFVEDLGSLNGVFVKLTQEQEIQTGEMFRIGQELIRFDAIPDPRPLEDGTEIMGGPNPGYWGRLSMVVASGIDGISHPLLSADVILGRERGDILFPDDGYVSGQHCRVSMRAAKFYLADVGSSNGTFLRFAEARLIPRGRFLLMGQQLFRLEYT